MAQVIGTGLGRFAPIRANVYIVPSSAAVLEAFYQQHWPGFRFFGPDEIEMERDEGTYSQFLFFQKDGSLRPAQRPKDMRNAKDNGVSLMVMEQRGQPAAWVELPIETSDVYCQIAIINNRGAKF